MKARRLLHILEARNVKLRAEGDRLKWDAPKGIITDDIKARMRDQKTELLALLQCKQADDYHEDHGEKVSEDEKHLVTQSKDTRKLPDNKVILDDCFVASKHLTDEPAEETKIKFTPNTIYQGHALEVLKAFPDESIDCVVTSPPYLGLRNYHTNPVIWNEDKDCEHDWQEDLYQGQKTPQTKWPAAKEAFSQLASNFCSKCGAWRGELGAEPTPELYVSHLCDIFDEVKRVLKPTGTCWINIADTYRNKSLVGIPEMFVLEMQKRGWIRRNNVIWWKPNCMPESVEDRLTKDFEPLYFFTKSKKYYFEQQFEPLCENTQVVYRERLRKIKTYTAKEPYSNNFPASFNTKGRNKRCVWKIATKPFKGAHFAVMPEELAKTPIVAGCPRGGIVLDCFSGSGTTCKVALDNGRQFVGIELNPGYIEMAKKRLDRPNVVWTSAEHVKPIKRGGTSKIYEIPTAGQADDKRVVNEAKKKRGKIVVLKPPANEKLRMAA